MKGSEGLITLLGGEATRSTSEPISQLDERSALGSKVAIACCTSRARRAIEKLEGFPLQWHRNGVCGTSYFLLSVFLFTFKESLPSSRRLIFVLGGVMNREGSNLLFL